MRGDDVRPQPAQAARAKEGWRDLRNDYEVYLSAFFIFLASRLVILVGLNFGNRLVPNPGSGHWDAGPYWYDKLLRWDAGLFASIVRDGYTNGSNAVGSIATTGSFPLYPLAAHAVKSVFGLNEYEALLLVANLAAVANAVLIAKFFKDELGREAALLAAAFFWFFPLSVFLSAGYSESLFITFVLLSFLLLRTNRFVFAAIAAGLSAGTRPVGLAMLPSVVWERLQHRTEEPKPRLILTLIVCGLLALGGVLGFATFLAIKFGDPLAFISAQQGWHPPIVDRLLSGSLLHPFRHVSIGTAGWFSGAMVLAVWSLFRLRAAVSLYGLGVLVIPYLTIGITDSSARFAVVCLPAFMVLGALCRKRPILSMTIIAVFSALLLRNSALFSQWYWLG